MAAAVWNLDESDGQLLVHTGVAGRAAKMGHRLTLAMDTWRASVTWEAAEPTEVQVLVEVASLRVVRGEGGVTPLTGPEKGVARSNALKSLGAEKFPEIRFQASDIAESDDGYRLTGTLEIHGKGRECTVDLRVQDLGSSWGMSYEAEVRQTDFGVRPFSMLMGSMKVADVVTVAFTAERVKDD